MKCACHELNRALSVHTCIHPADCLVTLMTFHSMCLHHVEHELCTTHAESRQCRDQGNNRGFAESIYSLLILIQVGHAVVQVLEALRYNPEGRGLYSRWCHCNFSLTSSFRPHYGPGVDSASNRNECQEYFLGG